MAEFNKNILEWVNCDNKIKSNNEVVKELRLKKVSLETNIIGYIQENNLEENIFNISSLDTQLKMNKTSVKESISYKFLENTFIQYFNETDLDNDCKKSKELLEFIKNTRECSDKYALKRD